MSDFGAGTCDFHNDFASDFRDFPGDFGGEPRTAKRPPEAAETAPPEQGTATGKATWERERRQAGSAPHKKQATEQWETSRHKSTSNVHTAIAAAAV